MRCLLFLALLLNTVAYAEEPPVFSYPGWQRSDKGIKLMTREKPSSIYFRRAPERLYLEFAGVRAQGMPPSAPRLPGISKIRWSQADLSHVVCELTLDYRLPADLLKWSADGLEISTDYSWEDRFRLTPAVVWTRMERAQAGRYLLWNQLQVDPTDTAVSLDLGLAKDRIDAREKTTQVVKRLGALAGVNGGYFASSGGPLGVVLKAGKLLSPHVSRRPPRTTLGVMKDGKMVFDQVTAKKGQLASRSGDNWQRVELALGGGPRLLRRGQVALTTDEEELGPRGNDITRITARTAVATTRDGKILIATASGYHDNHLQGLRLEELAGELLRRGSNEAMNLDGGASTVMALGDKVISGSPGGVSGETAVATTLLLKDVRVQPYPTQIQLRVTEGEMVADGRSKVKLEARVTDASGNPVADGTSVRFYAEKLGLTRSLAKTSQGMAVVEGLASRSPGQARIVADCAAARGQADLRLIAGPAKGLWTLLQPVASNPGKYSLTVQAVDAWGNGVGSLPIVVGNSSQLTGANGQTTFEVVQLPGSSARSLDIQAAGELKSTVQLPSGPAPSVIPSPDPSPTSSPDASPAGEIMPDP